MSEPKPDVAMNKKDLFLGLVHSFQGAAMQQLGKIPNPFTEKIERDLVQARLSIDVLEMLVERTSGNLTGEESRFLQHVLTELRLNYVAEIEEDKKGTASTPTPESTPPTPESTPPTPESTSP